MGISRFVCCFFLCFALSLFPASGWTQIDPRIKTVLFMSGMGSVGGALLGMASKAFNNSDSFGRALTKGASLGLYAGILFGSYVIVSHHVGKKSNRRDREYEDEASSYYEEDGYYDPFEQGRLQFWNPSYPDSFSKKHPLSFFYLNVLDVRF